MHYILNGKLISEDQIRLSINKNGSFWYGDGFFEVLKYSSGRIHFASLHWERIVSSCDILKMKNPFSDVDAFINCVHLLAKTSENQVQRIKMVLWRNTWQGYQPENDEAQFLITSFPLSDINYPLNINGLKLGIYSENLKSISKLGNVKSTSSQLYVLATLYTQQHQWDDSIILNSKKNIVETSRSNICIVKNETVHTPPLNEGCLDGIMRRVLLEICNENNIHIQQEPITLDMLKKAEEVFMSSSIRGIQWVGSVDERIYPSNQFAERLSKLLNEAI